jgi:hypothetical protein
MTNGEAYLFGKRAADTPLSLVDAAALVQNRMGVDAIPPIERSIADELLRAGYLEDEVPSGESVNVVLRITQKGLQEFSSGRKVSPAASPNG